MDDLPVDDNYLSTQCGLTVNCSRDETVVFVNIFTILLATFSAEIDDFVKITDATNAACPANGKVLIPASAIIVLKPLRFEL